MTLPAYAMNRASFPEMYEDLLVGPLFRPWVDELLDKAGLSPGDGVLDVACGTGIVARVARERQGPSARVVGVDVSPQMLDVARRMAPDIDWREGSATALPVAADERFDVVTCQQGLQFFPDRAAAAREMHRVLAPGGRAAVATWRSLEENPLFRDLHAVGERHVGPIADQRHAFGDAGALERLLRDAGFADVTVETVSRVIRFDDGGVLVRMNAMALVGMSAASKGMSDEERAAAVDAIARDSAGIVPKYRSDGGFGFDMSTNLAIARA